MNRNRLSAVKIFKTSEKTALFSLPGFGFSVKSGLILGGLILEYYCAVMFLFSAAFRVLLLRRTEPRNRVTSQYRIKSVHYFEFSVI